MDYQVKPLGRTCAVTGEPLAPGSVVFSVLLSGENGSWERRDISRDAWDGPPDGAVGHWTCRVPEPEVVTKRRLDPDEMMRLFERMTEEANPHRESLRFVLALLLVRKRRLEIDGNGSDDDEVLRLNGLHGEGEFEVRDPCLEPDEAERLQAELNALLVAEAG